MLPISKNQNRKTYRKVFNLALLALILIIWSCSTTETTGSSSRVDTIDLYETQVPLLYTGFKADGTANTNLLLSGFVKYPADGRLLNFEVADNEYGITTDTTSSDFFQYSMLRVASNDITNASDINIDVVVTAKNGSGRAKLTLTTDISFGDILHFAGINRRVASDGCEVKFGIIGAGATDNTSYNWFARFKPGPGVYISTRPETMSSDVPVTNNGIVTTNEVVSTNFVDTPNINLALVGLDGSGNVGYAYGTTRIDDDGNVYQTNIFTGRYTIENSPNPLLANVYPSYSALTLTIPRPNNPSFVSTDEPLNANVRNGVPVTFFGSSVTYESPTDNFVDYQCRAS